MGAFYSLLGRKSLIRVVAEDRDKCNDCMDCFEVCPEQQVIRPALRGAENGISPVILSSNCTNCGRCIDVCGEEVFHFGSRFFTAKRIVKNRNTAACISCHEMEVNVYEELQETIHFNNRTGVRATCPDCHVPKEWVDKFVRKIKASNELYHKFMGTIDTPEKFEAKRLQLAQNVWAEMKDTDSRECRNCHDFDSMDFERQESRSGDAHDEAIDKGWTCIDCHTGIAHSLPAGFDPTWNSPQ